MKAIVISEFGPVENLVFREVPKPTATPGTGTALIQVRGFGINHAEMHMRRGEWAESMPIPGIEAVGLVEDCPGGEFAIGTPVAAVMGGLGRTTNGSYAEYTVARTSNMVALGEVGKEPALPWDQLAALPETYCTAWTCLFGNLGLERGHTLLIRGATSSFGRAAINLAVEVGAIVTATTRKESRFNDLRALGASNVALEGPGLPQRLQESGKTEKFDRVLELVGNSTLVESLTLVRRHGRLCLAGFLGGLDPVKDFNPLLQMSGGVHFSFFGSFAFGTPEFPLSEVPLRDIVQSVSSRKFDARPSRVFGFEGIREAHRLMESGEANGKMVVMVA